MNYCSLILCSMLLVFEANGQEVVSLNKFVVNKSDESEVVRVTLLFEILEGYHIQPEIDKTDGFITTEISFANSEAYSIGPFEFTSKHYEDVLLGESIQEVMTNTFEVTLRMNFKSKSLDENHKLLGELYYQACTDRQCLFPRTLNFQIPIIKIENQIFNHK